MSQDNVSATAWTGAVGDEEQEVYWLEGDDVTVRAELSDVDEVALLVCLPADGDREPEVLAIHLDRVHAIALAGQLAKAATANLTDLPRGHVNG